MIPIADLRKHLRIPPTNTTETAYIADLERAAVAAIENYAHRYFGPIEEVTPVVLDGTGSDTLWLPDIPATGEDLDITVEEWNGTEWVATETADFETDGYALLHKASAWALGRRNVRVTYSRGYAPGEEPENVRQAVRKQVADWYENREPRSGGALSDEVKALVGRRLLV